MEKKVGRITSVHGVLLPPKRQRLVSQSDRYVTLRFVITGTIPSKKNMIWADSNFNTLSIPASATTVKGYWQWLKDNLRFFIRNSKKYKDWVEETKPAITAQAQAEIERYKHFGLSYPLANVSVKVYHYWKDNIARDNSNKYDTIIDLFTTSGIIMDDSWQVVRKNESESELYAGEILDHITTVDMTVRITPADRRSSV